jgi:hypothetical protein
VITERSVLWGDAELSLESGDVRRLHDLPRALAADSEVTEPPPGAGYRVAAAAWSPAGDRLIVVGAWIGPPGPVPARALLLDGEGHELAVLWEGDGLAPEAVWAGAEQVVLGTREPRVFDRAGALVKVLDGETPAARVDGDAGRLLICEHGELTVWSASGHERLAGWPGAWLDAAFVPGRGLVVALDLTGAAFVVSLEAPAQAAESFALPDPARGIAIGGDRIAVSFMYEPLIRTARIG